MTDEAPKVDAKNIDEAIAAVYATVGFVPKTKGNGDIKYSYAGEAAIIEKVRPAMVENGIVVRVLEVLEYALDTYTTKSGSVMNQTTLRAKVRFTHAPSQSFVDCEALGQGADTGDKSANKAMTGAFKYAIRQTFMLETGDDPDDTSSKDQEREHPANNGQRGGGYMKSNGKGSPLPAPDEPSWYHEFTGKVKDAGLSFDDLGGVLGVRVTKASWRGDVGRWLASDPEHSIAMLVSRMADKKDAGVSDAIV